jgi:tetratricopeptide (TPR) repeat protein
MPLRILAIALSMLWFAAVARADAASGQSQPPDTADEGYEATVQLALREFGLGNYAEARTLLRDAHGLYANARTLRALGMVEYELKNYPACVAYLEQALSSQERPLSAEHRKGADELMTDHPYGLASEPYASGLPAGFPSSCVISP